MLPDLTSYLTRAYQPDPTPTDSPRSYTPTPELSNSPLDLACFFSFLRAASSVTEESSTPPYTLMQHKIVQDRDFYLPFRQLSPSKRIILNDPQGPFSPARLRTQGGFFDALIFRLITQASPILLQEKRVCFGSLTDFRSAVKDKAQSDYCNLGANGRHDRRRNIPHIPTYWKHAADWSELVNGPKMTLKSLMAWFTSQEGRKTRFFGMGNLVGWLLASDYAYAGLVTMPDVSEVGKIIFKIDAGGKAGLRLLGFKVDTSEECVQSLSTLWTVLHSFLTQAEIEEMGLDDPVTLEHALCKFKRLYRVVKDVSYGSAVSPYQSYI